MAGPPTAPDRPVTSGRARLRASLLPGAFAVLVLALAAAGLLLARSIRHYDDVIDQHRATRPAGQRAAAIDAARREVVNLLTVSDKTSSQNLKALLDGSTANFHKQLLSAAKSFQQALSKGKVSSTGTVAAAGVVSSSPRAAVVAVAAKGIVKNSSSPKGEPRNYRLTVTVQRVGHRWLVSDLRFVV